MKPKHVNLSIVVAACRRSEREEQSEVTLSTKLFINPSGEALQRSWQSSCPWIMKHEDTRW